MVAVLEHLVRGLHLDEGLETEFVIVLLLRMKWGGLYGRRQRMFVREPP